jgi:hypothetical protein
MALPSNISFGTVTGVFTRAVADTADADRDPDAIPVSDMTVTFTSSLTPPRVRDASAVPPVTILIDSIVAHTDSSGVLIGPDGAAGIRLVASTDPDLNPTNWTWNVTLSSPSMMSISFSFALDADQTIDLSTVIPVPPSLGTALPDWQQAVADTLANKAAAQQSADAAAASAQAAEDAAASIGPGGGVTSVNGQTGAVVLDAADVGAYVKPSTGIPKTDLAPAVQTSLSKADTALQSAPVTSVAGKTGAVTLAKADVGLGSVDNTADASKPVSAAQATAINAKYTKPGTGIPKTDLAADVQTSLGKADSALQTAPVTSVNGQTGDVVVAASGALSAQYIPDIGGTFTSGFWTSNSSGGLRSADTTAMPILIYEQISIDQASFVVNTVAGTATTATINLMSFNGSGWDVIQELASGIALNDATGIHTATFTPVQLAPGLYGIQVREPTSYDSSLKVAQGHIIGPATPALDSTYRPNSLPVGTNTSIVSGVTVVVLRRSA